MFGRKKKETSPEADHRGRSEETERTLTPGHDEPSKATVKRATRTRLCFTLFCSFLLLISIIFLILVEIGNLYPSQAALMNIYFIKLDLTNIAPQTIPNATLLNSIARTLGLHDFYQVGLWNFCEGYNNQGVTNCSAPQTLYWFNPVQILLSELLAGATISLPSNVTDILDLIQMVSRWMFGLFLAGACLNFILIFLQPLSVISRWMALFIGTLTFLGALFVTVASVIATVLFVIMQNAFTSVTELNIGASIGVRMFVFMWIASGTSILAWLIQTGLCCCCASRRDVKKGKKRGSKKAYRDGENLVVDEKPKRGVFGRKKATV